MSCIREGAVAVSACLMGTACRYDGRSKADARLISALAGRQVIAFCPELAGGLPTPRLPSEIKDGRVVRSDGADVDQAYRRGTEAVLRQLRGHDVSVVVVQPHSPACGLRRIYDGTFSGTLTEGRGVLAEALIRAGYKVVEPSEAYALFGQEG